jgi:hypothetical protein
MGHRYSKEAMRQFAASPCPEMTVIAGNDAPHVFLLTALNLAAARGDVPLGLIADVGAEEEA